MRFASPVFTICTMETLKQFKGISTLDSSFRSGFHDFGIYSVRLKVCSRINETLREQTQ